MIATYARYAETFPEDFSIKHKISANPEKKNYHLHKQLEIVFALSGNLKCKLENGIVDIPQNGMILFNKMDLHYILSDPGSGACDRYVLYFSSNYISTYSTPEINLLECFLLRPENQPVVLAVPDSMLSQTLGLLDRLNLCHEQDAQMIYGKELYLKFLLGEFLLLTNQLYFQQYGFRISPAYRSRSQLVYEIYDYIGEHYNEKLNSEEISRLFLISKTQLYNVFKEVSGTTVSGYICEYRIAKAKDFLINTEYSVEQISQMTGYESISSFSRAFKHRARLSPIQYRKKYTADKE